MTDADFDFSEFEAQFADVEEPEVEDLSKLGKVELWDRLQAYDDQLKAIGQISIPWLHQTEEGRRLHAERALVVTVLHEKGYM